MSDREAQATDADALEALHSRIQELEMALDNTATMLDFEALCHEESDVPRRLEYVEGIRRHVAWARRVLSSGNAVPVSGERP